jgi:hypothetical protein
MAIKDEEVKTLHERATILRYPYIAYLVTTCVEESVLQIDDVRF